MKVMIIVPSLRATGVTRVIGELLHENKKEKRVNYILVALRDVHVNNLKEYNPIILKYNTIFSLQQVKRLKRVLKREHPDIVHFHGFNSEIYLPFIKNKDIKFMTTSHNLGKIDFVLNYGKIGYFMAIFQRYVYKQMDALVGVSDTVTSHYKKLNLRMTTIYNGENVLKIKKSKNKLPVGIYIGNLESRKNVDLLFSYYKLRKYRLIVLGDDPTNNQKINEYKKAYPMIDFEGRVKNIFNFIDQADYFISASQAEGLPMAAIEAMGSGLDLILSNIEPHRELKKYHNQEIVFFENNYKSLALVLNKYLDKYKPRISKNNLIAYNTFFTSSKMYKNYVKLYTKLLKEK